MDEMKEVNRQIAMGHARGRQLGRVEGMVAVTLLFALATLISQIY